VGDNTRAAEAMAARFRDAGYPESDVRVLIPMPRKGNVVVRLHEPELRNRSCSSAYRYVVEANRSGLVLRSVRVREQDGYFYGRGTQDMKGATTPF